MPELKELVKAIENFAPVSLCADYDNSGMKLGDPHSEITGVLATLDVNYDVVEEAREKGCNLIIEHHPSIWKPLKNIDLRRPLNRALLKAYENDIAIYSCHTNMDFAKGGLGDYFAEKAGICDPEVIESCGARVGELKRGISLKEYALKLSKIFDDDNVRVIGDLGKKIEKVALINGSGGSDEAVFSCWENKTDVLVTAEVKYSAARLANDLNYAIIELGHFNCEKIFGELIVGYINKCFPNVKAMTSEKSANPYNRRVDLWD